MMPVSDEQARAIFEEERDATRRAIRAAATLTDDAKADAVAMCEVILDAVNEAVSELPRTLDARVLPTALRAMADEHERLMRRLREAGLARTMQ